MVLRSPLTGFAASDAADGRRRPNPRTSLSAWLTDLRSSHTTARRLFLRHIAQQYRFSSLGLLWVFAPSVLTALVLIGGQRAHVLGPSGEIPAAFYGVFGIALAQTFLEALNATRRVFASHQQLLKRQNVPLEGLIVAALIEIGFTMVVRLVVIAAVFFFFAVRPLPTTLPLALFGYLGVAAVGAGLGLLVAPIGALKRDVEHAFALLPWALFAVTPVFVPVVGGVFGRICAVNPLGWLFDGIRAAAYGGHGNPAAAVGGAAVGIMLIAAGWFFCRFARPHVVERMLV